MLFSFVGVTVTRRPVVGRGRWVEVAEEPEVLERLERSEGSCQGYAC